MTWNASFKVFPVLSVNGTTHWIVESFNRTLKTKMWKYFTQRNPNLRRRSIQDGRILWPHRSQNHRQKSRGITKQRCQRGYMEERDPQNRAHFTSCSLRNVWNTRLVNSVSLSVCKRIGRRPDLKMTWNASFKVFPVLSVNGKNTKKQKERSPELGRLLKQRLRPRRGSCKHGVDILQPFSSRQLWRIE
jgi:hypothetical protein